MTLPLAPVITSFFVFGVKVQLFIFKGIKLKFGEGINSKNIFHFNFVKQNEFDKNYGVVHHFLQILLDLCSIKVLP